MAAMVRRRSSNCASPNWAPASPQALQRLPKPPFRFPTKFTTTTSDHSTAQMDAYVNKVVQIITNDGRVIVGVLKGFDQTTNVILEECHERVFSTDAGVEQVVLGLYIVRGDNIAIVGEVDEEKDAELDLNAMTAEPLKPVVH